MLCVFSVQGQQNVDSKAEKTLRWSQVEQSPGDPVYYFNQVIYDEQDLRYPLFAESVWASSPGMLMDLQASDPVFEKIAEKDLLPSVDRTLIPAEFTWYQKTGTQKSRYVTTLFVNPFYTNGQEIYRLTSFAINSHETEGKRSKVSNVFEESSVMSSGDWYPFYISESGMYQITGTELEALGIDLTGLNPENIAVFGNGGAMLPETNEEERPSDIQEVAIEVQDGGDGSFDANDKLVFYAEGPRIWRYNTRYHRYEHHTNLYTDEAGYFVAILDRPGLRIGQLNSVGDEPTHIADTYTRLVAHDEEEKNLLKSGKRWVGHQFTATENEFTIDDIFLPDIDTSADLYLLTELLHRSMDDNSSFYIYHDDALIHECSITGITDNSTFARAKTAQGIIQHHSDEHMDLHFVFEPGNSNSLGWIDYLELHAECFLRYRGDAFPFRNLPSYGYQRVAEFKLQTGGNEVRIWDVTTLNGAAEVNYELHGDTAVFTRPSQDLHEYYVFNDNNLSTPRFGAKIENQDLHAATPVDYLVITHPTLMEPAEQIAALHEQHDGMTTMIVTPQEIYNEFSSGVQDIAAIRDFIRSMYLKSGEQKPDHVLLMGDASYDYKERIDENQNLIPTFQSEQSLTTTTSWDTDDFFALMDDDEGLDSYGILDMGVGRIPVSTPEQGILVVAKIEKYLSNDIETFGDWKNKVVFIADDGDSNMHQRQSEDLSNKVDTLFHNVNIDKIYFDAYQRISVSGGYRYPDAKDAIVNAVEEGVILVNYTGHGGETGWGIENVLEIPDINAWTNIDHLPVFITATCEFSRYDNPGHTSAGELVILNPNGGAVSMLTTSRLSFAQINFSLNWLIFDIALNPVASERPTIGEYMIYGKVPSRKATKNFVILGDPALKLKLPEYTISTDQLSIMDDPATLSIQDTIRGMEHLTVKGTIRDFQNNPVTDFNGSICVKLYDKPSIYTTLGQAAPDGSPQEFSLMDKVLFNGVAEVNDGAFEVEMLVPKELNYQYGAGKISYYAIDSANVRDACGYYEKLVIGGYNIEAMNDNSGPEIIPYMNNSAFENGDKTNENPIFIAEITDPCGINYIGNSIGHDIIAWLDDDVDQIIDLNIYYTPSSGVYNKGTVVYPFSHLEEGRHTLTIKAWDLCNNSTVTTLDFVVSSTLGVEISNARVYPNPAEEEVFFTFMHNMPGKDLEVRFEVYDLAGRKIYQWERSDRYTTTQVTPYRWDLRNHLGTRVESGAYPYRMRVRTGEGDYTIAGGTLLIK